MDERDDKLTPIGDLAKKAAQKAQKAHEQAGKDPKQAQYLIEIEATTDRFERAERLRDSGVAPMLRNLDAYRIVKRSCKQTRYLEKVSKWLGMEQQYVVLLGPVGRGKTIAGAWALASIGGMYLRARACERLFAANFGEEAKERDRALSVRLLMIDDLGTETKQDAIRSALSEIIDARQGECKTIFTANMNRDQFVERYLDARELSRFQGSALFIGDDGDDMRGTE